MTEREHQIIRAATTLLLAEGVGVSTASIARGAGVSNGTLFNVFATKQDLIDAIYVSTKNSLADALDEVDLSAFNRDTVRGFWTRHLEWSRANPAERQVMHLLRESGLASDRAKAKVDARYHVFGVWLEEARVRGLIKGPSVAFIGALMYAQLDLVIAHELSGEDESLAFDMLCQAIGLSQ